MIFGIYPGGMAGTASGMTTGPKDDPGKISHALARLQGSAPAFLVRSYTGYKGKNQPITIVPDNPLRYLTENRSLDLVLCFQSNDTNLDGWKEFIREQVKKYHQHLRYLQITEEANVNLPSLDGYYPGSRKALVEGVIFAKNEIRSAGLSTEVGFNATPDFNPDRRFWKEIRALATGDFYRSLDYVGLDCFPDVFRPLPRDNGKINPYEPLRQLISFFRNDIADAGIRSDIPLHITENGWPTNTTRTEAAQATALDLIIRAIHSMRSEFHIRTYEMFDLRDADSSSDDIFHRFGIMNDDYSPKPAFETYCSLISELS